MQGTYTMYATYAIYVDLGRSRALVRFQHAKTASRPVSTPLYLGALLLALIHLHPVILVLSMIAIHGAICCEDEKKKKKQSRRLPRPKPPFSLLHVPLVVVVAHIRAQALDVLGHVGLDLAVANVGEAIAVAVADIVVLEARSLDGLEEMDSLQD